MIRFAFSFFVILATLSSAGCSSSCRELANRICECQPTQAKKDSCYNSISAIDSTFDASDEQEEFCQSILDSGQCTCESLAAGQWTSCGLANDPLK